MEPRRDLRPGQHVKVWWLDPAVGSHWTPGKEVKTVHVCSCRSIGWIHLANDDGLVITSCFAMEEGETEDEADRDLLLRQYLPWGCIEQMCVFKNEEGWLEPDQLDCL